MAEGGGVTLVFGVDATESLASRHKGGGGGKRDPKG